MNLFEHEHRVLLVDDNPSIHQDFRSILLTTGDDELAAAEAELFGDAVATARDNGPQIQFELHSAKQGQQALKLVEESVRTGRRFAMAFVDMRMPPGWNGIETIQRLWKVDPNLEVVICTAYLDFSWREVTAVLGQTDQFVILKKPFEAVEVRQLARSLCAKAMYRAARSMDFQSV